MGGGGLSGWGKGRGAPGADQLCDLRQTALSGLPFKIRDPIASGGPEGQSPRLYGGHAPAVGDLGAKRGTVISSPILTPCQGGLPSFASPSREQQHHKCPQGWVLGWDRVLGFRHKGDHEW